MEELRKTSLGDVTGFRSQKSNRDYLKQLCGGASKAIRTAEHGWLRTSINKEVATAQKQSDSDPRLAVIRLRTFASELQGLPIPDGAKLALEDARRQAVESFLHDLRSRGTKHLRADKVENAEDLLSRIDSEMVAEAEEVGLLEAVREFKSSWNLIISLHQTPTAAK